MENPVSTKKKTLRHILIIFVVAFGFCVLLMFMCALIARQSLQDVALVKPSEIESRTVYKHLIADSSEEPKNLQGFALTWQGYQAFLRFSGCDGIAQELVEQGYTETSWEDIHSIFGSPQEKESMFSSPWSPESIKNKKCLIRGEITNSWTHSGVHYYVIDLDTGEVYFYGLGI